MAGTNHIEGGTIMGTVGGTLLAVIVNLNSQDISKTVVLGAIGACVSFTVTMLLKYLYRKIIDFIQMKH